MAALAWLLIPLAAAVVAALWGRWAARHRSTGDGASLAGYERFRTAMETGALGEEQAGDEESPRGPVVGPVP
ncbi:MAG: hypothetical protein QOF98_2880 [Streptomyces sp.]|nr:hypothetical protein [Streptomyces sp.]